MQKIWFAVALVFLILSVAGLVTAAVLCFCRQRATTPRHPHNAHNAQSHPPVSFPCESQKAHTFASAHGLYFLCHRCLAMLLGACVWVCVVYSFDQQPVHRSSTLFQPFFTLENIPVPCISELNPRKSREISRCMSKLWQGWKLVWWTMLFSSCFYFLTYIACLQWKGWARNACMNFRVIFFFFFLAVLILNIYGIGWNKKIYIFFFNYSRFGNIAEREFKGWGNNGNIVRSVLLLLSLLLYCYCYYCFHYEWSLSHDRIVESFIVQIKLHLITV